MLLLLLAFCVQSWLEDLFIFTGKVFYKQFSSSLSNFLNDVCCRVQSLKSVRRQYHKSLRLIMMVAILYCLWCASQIYLVSPRRPAVGEEADLGVLVFLCIFFFFPHWLCILSMNAAREVVEEQLPL